MTLRRDGDGGDGGDGGDDQPDERKRTQNSWPTSLERQLLDETLLAGPAPPAATRGRREQKPSPQERQLLDKQLGGGRRLRHLLLSWKLVALWKEADVDRNYSRLTSGPISVNRNSIGPGTFHPECWEPADAAETSPPPHARRGDLLAPQALDRATVP